MISEHAIISPDAKIGQNVTIGPGSIIGANVDIGDGTWIGPHAIVQGPTVIGKNNKIYQFASLGDAPQDLTYQNEPTELKIGDNNIFREFVTISRGTVKGGGVTTIGNDNFFMAYAHAGHDCIVGNANIMINHAALAGHVKIEDYTTIGAYAGIHQYCQVGSHAFIARATYVTKDVLPYILIAGHTTSACGINSVGLRRREFSSHAINQIRRAYKVIFRKGLTVAQAIEELHILREDCIEIEPMIMALHNATRGIVR